MHSPHQVSFALSLVTEGMSDREVAACTGIPRRTIYDWRAGRVPIRLRTPCDVCGGRPERLPGPAYAYLLGLYLGDGCISAAGRTYRLRIACDAGYPGLVDACVAALETLMPRKSAWAGRRPSSRCIDVSMYSNHWPCLLPQHGPGRKHHRPIALEAWQEAIIARQQRHFVRGLIHSDGCRVVANDRGVESVRYHFSNRSDDIRTLLCRSLDALGVRWTRPCWKEVAIYRKASVAILDSFVGPKS